MSMHEKMPQQVHPAKGPAETVSDQRVSKRRDALVGWAERLAALDAEFPAALDLAAELIDAAHAVLSGKATDLTVGEPTEHTRARIRGDRGGPTLTDLTFWATHPAREPRQIARMIGERLIAAADARSAAADAHEVLAQVQEAHSAFSVEMLRDLSDGDFSATEARDLRPDLARVKESLARAEAVIEAAERRGPRAVSR